MYANEHMYCIHVRLSRYKYIYIEHYCFKYCAGIHLAYVGISHANTCRTYVVYLYMLYITLISNDDDSIHKFHMSITDKEHRCHACTHCDKLDWLSVCKA